MITLASLWSWFVLGVVIAVWLPMMAIVRVVTAPFDKGRYWTGYLFRKLTVVHQRLNPLWHFSVSGPLPDDPRRPYIVVSNHESFVDILLISHLPWEMKWLSKIEMFKIPVVGWMMRLAGDVPLRRGESTSAVAAMAACKDRLDQRVSVMIFPEGTRSPSGELQAFKDGAFRLAVETGTTILPLAVHGTRTALRKHDWRLGRSRAEVRVLEPVEVTGLGPDDVGALREQRPRPASRTSSSGCAPPSATDNPNPTGTPTGSELVPSPEMSGTERRCWLDHAGGSAAGGHQTCFVGAHDELGTVAGVELHQQPGHMGLARGRTHVEQPGDLGVRVAAGDEHQHLAFPARQTPRARWRVRSARGGS